MYEAILADSGLRATQYTALQVLSFVPRLTTTEIAEALGMDQTTATRTLALVRKRGLAIDSAGSDRRERHWTLTSAGAATVTRLKPAWESAQQEFERKLGPKEAAALKKAAYHAASKLATN